MPKKDIFQGERGYAYLFDYRGKDRPVDLVVNGLFSQEELNNFLLTLEYPKEELVRLNEAYIKTSKELQQLLGMGGIIVETDARDINYMLPILPPDIYSHLEEKGAVSLKKREIPIDKYRKNNKIILVGRDYDQNLGFWLTKQGIPQFVYNGEKGQYDADEIIASISRRAERLMPQVQTPHIPGKVIVNQVLFQIALFSGKGEVPNLSLRGK